MMRKPLVFFGSIALLFFIVAVSYVLYIKTRPGSLVINYFPIDSHVKIDGVESGSDGTARLEKISPGRHFVLVSHDDYHDQSVKITIIPKEKRKVSIELKRKLTTGTLNISSDPQGCEVFIDGKSLSKVTPARIDLLQKGKHLLSLRKHGYKEWHNEIQVSAERTSVITKKLDKLPTGIIFDGREGLCVYTPENGQTRLLAKYNPYIHFNRISVSYGGDYIASSSDLADIYIFDFKGKLINTLRRDAIGNQFGVLIESVEYHCWNPTINELLISYHTDTFLDDRSFLALYNIRSGKLRLLSPKIAKDSGGSYSPDGKQIAFIRSNEIYIADNKLNIIRKISNSIDTSTICAPIIWSPKGNYLYCNNNDKDKPIIIDTEGNIVKEINERLWSASWSPDGESIICWKGSGSGIDQISVDTLSSSQIIDKNQLKDSMASDAQPAWGYLKEPGSGIGKLEVNSKTPGYKIAIDGKMTGKVTPFTFALMAGSHTVSVQANGSTLPSQFPVVVEGEETKVSF